MQDVGLIFLSAMATSIAGICQKAGQGVATALGTALLTMTVSTALVGLGTLLVGEHAHSVYSILDGAAPWTGTARRVCAAHPMRCHVAASTLQRAHPLQSAVPSPAALKRCFCPPCAAKYKLAQLVQYMPLPVIAGYLGFVGYFCIASGIGLGCSIDIGSIPRSAGGLPGQQNVPHR